MKLVTWKAKALLSLSLFLLISFTSIALEIPSNSEEALTLRRILAFLQDGDAAIAQAETDQFLLQYPNTTYRDHLHILLGDLYMTQQHYFKAFEHYSVIKESSLNDRALMALCEIKSTIGGSDEATHALLLLSQRTPEQQAILDILLGRIYFASGEYQKALTTLLPLLNEKRQTRDSATDKVVLMTVLASSSHLGQTDQMEKWADRFLEEYPAEQHQLHLNLFDAYLQLAENTKENDALLDLAAEHLYRAGLPVKKENLLWLADYYVKKSGLQPLSSNSEEIIPLEDAKSILWAQRAKEILLKSLGESPNPQFEREWFLLSVLCGCLDQTSEQILNLQALLKMHSETPSKLHIPALFSLAQAYEKQGDQLKALDYYQQLIGIKSTDPLLVNTAKLHWARLMYASIPIEKRSLENPDMLAVLKILKDLQMRRQFQHEPLHLEAAIDYATFRSSVEPPEKQDEQRRLLLQRIKEEFTSQDGLWAKDYHATRAALPEKAVLYQAYLMLIDAHRLKLEAKLAAAKGQSLDAQIKGEAASALYKSLIQGKFAVSKYVADQAKSGL